MASPNIRYDPITSSLDADKAPRSIASDVLVVENDRVRYHIDSTASYDFYHDPNDWAFLFLPVRLTFVASRSSVVIFMFKACRSH